MADPDALRVSKGPVCCLVLSGKPWYNCLCQASALRLSRGYHWGDDGAHDICTLALMTRTPGSGY